jgi:putative oxidoreductase
MTGQSKYLAPGSEAAYAALRMVSGATFAFFGVQKVFGVLSQFKPEVWSQIWFGGVIELVAGTLILLGLRTPWAAFLSSGTMAVAYTQFHWKLEFGEKFFPAVNQGTPALLYCFLFLYMACKGSGIASLDGILARRSKSN